MGKRYHCDYCNKTFQDNLASRKRHLESVTHQRNRKAHYDSLRDPSTILANEMQKKTPCRSFMIDGSCSFGDSCRFSHLTEQWKADLEELILETKKKKHCGTIVRHSIHDWLRKREEKNKTETESKPEEPEEPPVEVPVYELAEELRHIPNLPISMLPPPPSALVGTMEEWG